MHNKVLAIGNSFCLGIVSNEKESDPNLARKEEMKESKDSEKIINHLALWGNWSLVNIEESGYPINFYTIKYQTHDYYPVDVACGSSHALILGNMLDVSETNFSPLENCADLLRNIMNKFMADKHEGVSDFMQIYNAIQSKDLNSGKQNNNDNKSDFTLEIHKKGNENNRSNIKLEKSESIREYYIQKTDFESTITSLFKEKVIDSSKLNELHSKLVQPKNQQYNLEDLWDQLQMEQCKTTKLFQITFLEDKALYSIVRFPRECKRVTSIACGLTFSLALSSESAMYSWGEGIYGELGLGEKLTNSKIPKIIPNLKDVIFISTGHNHAFCITRNDKVFAWGNGKNHRLGLGTDSNEWEPKIITALMNMKVMYITGGGQHSALITKNNRLYTWGCALGNRLGLVLDSSQQNVKIPSYVESIPAEVIKVSCGFANTLVLTLIGEVLSFGEDLYINIKHIFRPNNKSAITEIVAGMNQSYYIDNNSKLFGWGKNKFNMIHINTELNTKQNFEKPTAIDGLEMHISKSKDTISSNQSLSSAISNIYCPENATVILTHDGVVTTIGSIYNGCGKYKIENFKKYFTNYFIAIACGNAHVLAITEMGRLFGWGCNNKKQIGLDQPEVPNPTPSININKNVKFCACGKDYSAVITFEGTAIMFGDGAHHTLGIKDDQVNGVQFNELELSDVVYISCGTNHVLAICKVSDNKSVDQDGNEERTAVYSWGHNEYGQLGLGAISVKEVKPQQIDCFKDIFIYKVCCGDTISMALSENKEVYFWGNREYSDNETLNLKYLPPMKLNAFADKIDDISICENAIMCLSEKKEIYKWGGESKKTSNLKLGTEVIGKNSKSELYKAIKICCGYGHHAFIKENYEIMECIDTGKVVLDHENKSLSKGFFNLKFKQDKHGVAKEKKEIDIPKIEDKIKKDSIKDDVRVEKVNIISKVKAKLIELQASQDENANDLDKKLKPIKKQANIFQDNLEKYKINAESMLLQKLDQLKIEIKKSSIITHEMSSIQEERRKVLEHVAQLYAALKYHPCYIINLYRLCHDGTVFGIITDLFSITYKRNLNQRSNKKYAIKKKEKENETEKMSESKKKKDKEDEDKRQRLIPIYKYLDKSNYSFNLLSTLCKLIFIEDFKSLSLNKEFKESNDKTHLFNQLKSIFSNGSIFLNVYNFIFCRQSCNIKASINFAGKIFEEIITKHSVENKDLPLMSNEEKKNEESMYSSNEIIEFAQEIHKYTYKLEPKPSSIFKYKEHLLSEEIKSIIEFCIEYLIDQLKLESSIAPLSHLFAPLLVYKTLEYIHNPKMIISFLLKSEDKGTISYIHKKFESNKVIPLLKITAGALSYMYGVSEGGSCMNRLFLQFSE